jgi:nickel/cobalt exporter
MIRVRWLLPCLMLALALLLASPAKEAEAHPLGNFTINHYSRLDFAGEDARITYVLDLAEIPTFQQRSLLDADGDGRLSDAEAAAYLDAELPGLLEGIRLTVGGEDLPARVLDSSASYRPGQGGLPTLRIEAHLLADLPEDWEERGAAHYADRNHEDRPGWREIVVRGGPGVAIEGSTAPSRDVSNGLRSYPQDRLSSPPDQREARFTLVPGNGSAGQAEVATVNDDATNRLASLISVDRLSLTAIAIAVLAAFFWGAAHALTPGHGKAVVAAYLIGARGTVRHAGLLGLTVTLTHTAGVFALGAVTLFLSRYVLPEALYPWLNVVSGLLVVAIGSSLLYRRLRNAPGDRPEHSHPHDHGHSHGDHAHSHRLPGEDGSEVTPRGLLALGVSGGMVPCPAALVLLLSTISLGRVGFGMALVVAFSAGLAIVLTGIGILMLYARRVFERFSFQTRAARFLPLASAAAISLAGLAILLGSLEGTGII